MIRKFLIKLLVKLCVKEARNIHKVSGAEELKMYMFKNSDATLKLIKSLMSVQVIRHYEADTEYEKLLTKGAGMILKIMKEAHLMAYEIHKIQDPDMREKAWMKLKMKKRTN